MKPILTLKAVPNPTVENPYSAERIHILQFNYDGKGSAIMSFNDRPELEVHAERDVTMILTGDPGSGVRWYLPE